MHKSWVTKFRMLASNICAP